MQAEFQGRTELLQRCRRWSDALAAIAGERERIGFLERGMQSLLADRPLFAAILEGLGRGGDYPDIRQGTMFDNEYILHRDAQRLFSLRLFIFEPGEHTPIHDHSAWGVYGAVLGELTVRRYRREDDGARAGFASLRETGRSTLAAGAATEVTPPFDAGIHSTGNSNGSGVVVMLSAYGRPFRRLYIQTFDPEKNRVRRLFPPRIRKKMLAAQALSGLTG
jgi:hypothetical protein